MLCPELRSIVLLAAQLARSSIPTFDSYECKVGSTTDDIGAALAKGNRRQGHAQSGPQRQCTGTAMDFLSE